MGSGQRWVHWCIYSWQVLALVHRLFFSIVRPHHQAQIFGPESTSLQILEATRNRFGNGFVLTAFLQPPNFVSNPYPAAGATCKDRFLPVLFPRPDANFAARCRCSRIASEHRENFHIYTTASGTIFRELRRVFRVICLIAILPPGADYFSYRKACSPPSG